LLSICLIPYFYFRPEPLMTPIYWNLVFTALNIYWICRLLCGEPDSLPSSHGIVASSSAISRWTASW
jgi:hypothetical protein